MKKLVAALALFCFALSVCNPVYSQTPPSGQSAGGMERQQQGIAQEKRLEKRITTPKKKAEEAPIEKFVPVEGGPKTLVKSIEVRGATLIPKENIAKVIKLYEGKELTVGDMQKACDLITEEYRIRGRVTSRAYLPPQTIKDGNLVIVVIEGKVGTVDVKGNEFFSSKLIKKKLHLKSGEYFDYKSLQRSLVKINEHPDRFVKSVLVPGKDPGTTDIVLEVKDHLPVHVGYEYDNFGSRYINYDRHTITAENNNMLGLDDKFAFKYQQGQNVFYELTNLRYTIPLLDVLEAGVYWLWSRTKLGKEFKAQDITGKSQLGGISLSYTVISMDTVDMKVNCGFDYKHIDNYTAGVKTSRDEDRVVKVGMDLDMTDRYGRTIVTLEEDVGICGGDLHKKDPLATNPGAGAEFGKLIGNLYRLQPMPFSSSILWKNSFQATNYNMLAVEQFQVGGISNVRGYAAAEYSGDQGLTSTVEWSFPVYCIPKYMKVPYSKSSFYDATRLVAFYDMGYLHINDPSGTEKSNRTLQGYGGGVRFNLPEDFSARFEFAYRFNSKASISDANLYWDVSKKF